MSKLDDIAESRYRKLISEAPDEETKKMIEEDMEWRRRPYLPRSNWIGHFLFLFTVFAIVSLILCGLLYVAGCTVESLRGAR